MWGSVRLIWLALVAAFVLPACEFDTTSESSLVGEDAALSESDAADCDGDPVASIAVNGATAPPETGAPLARVLVGDTVELRAEVACAGELGYRWVIEPSTTLIGSTASPDLRSASVTVYPLRPDAYTARLTVTSAGGETTVSSYAFDAAGWRPLDQLAADAVVTDLTTDADHLWATSSRGAYRIELDAPFAGPYQRVDELYGGIDLPEALSTVYAAAGEEVWLASDRRGPNAWRIDLAASTIDAVDFAEPVMVRDLGPATDGARAATDRGVFIAEEPANFVLERSDDSYAVATGPGGAASGGAKLYPLPNGAQIDVFGGNNRIRALAADDAGFWAGGDNKGVARLVEGTVESIYSKLQGHLPDDRIHAIAVDDAGDVWVATARGLARFKRDREEWVTMAFGTGLDDHLDLRAIAVDEHGGRRAIYAGSDRGLLILSLD